MTGKKFDGGKLRYDLVPVLAYEDQVKGLTYGTIKYYDDNWIKVPNGRKRYLAAGLRHIQEYRKGNLWDEEQGIHHLSAAINNFSFIVEKDLQGWEDVEEEKTSPELTFPSIETPQEWQYPKTVLYADANYVGTPRNQDGTLPYRAAGDSVV